MDKELAIQEIEKELKGKLQKVKSALNPSKRDI